MWTALQILLLLAIPALVLWLERRVRAVKALSAVVVCYGVGIGLANLPLLSLPRQPALDLCGVAIALAIPLLLLTLDVVRWSRLARATLISFVLIVVCVCVVSMGVYALLGARVAHGAEIAGMLVGVYTGGTVNLAAIGAALRVPGETMVLVNAADLLAGTIFLPYLLLLAPRQWGRVLPPTPRSAAPVDEAAVASPDSGLRVRQAALALLLATACLGVGWLGSRVVPGLPAETAVLLGVTTLAIALSFNPAVRRLRASQDLGQYFLLVFCVAAGSTADVRQLPSGWLVIFAYVALVLYGSAALHVLLASLLGLDRDTVMVTSTAAIYGPAFIGPLVLAIGNREMMIGGVTTGLVGYAVGNYLGLGVAWLLMSGGA